MDYKALLSKEWVRYVAILLIGITVGVIFYPTSRIEETVSQKYKTQIASMKEAHTKELIQSTERYNSQVQENLNLRIQTEKKLNALALEIRDLKSKQKTSYYKLVKPDGTIEIKRFSETEVTESTKVIVQIQEEFKQKIDQIETKWSSIHKERVSILKKEFDAKESEYQKTISQLQMTKITTSNEKRFGLEAGLLTDKSYYAHGTMDVWGPLYLGFQGQYNNNGTKQLGIGLGLRF